jgi:hypothetical protein
MSLPVAIDTRVTYESMSPKKVKLRSKVKFNGCIVNFTVKEDLTPPNDGLGTGTLTATVSSILSHRDQMNDLLAYNVGDSVLVCFDYTAGLWMDNVEFG